MIRTISPLDGSVLVERPLADAAAIDATLAAAHAAQRAWRAVPLSERIGRLHRFVDAFVALRDPVAEEITRQMGRPLRYAPGEVAGFEDRARTMLRLAPQALAPVVPPEQPGFRRRVVREPLGVVLVLAPWNYPYLTAVNAIVPALAAGNTVVLKHSDQTPLCAERLSEAAAAADLPPGVFAHLHASHEQVAGMVQDPRVGFVAFTGSVGGGHAVVGAAASRFVGVGLELGGKDAAYVRADADLAFAVENVVDGAMFNSGQSCCGIERVFVHHSLYDAFVDGVVQTCRGYRLGDPMDPETTLGPMVRASNADHARRHVAAAVAAGARNLLDGAGFRDEGPWLGPQVLVDVEPMMDVMAEETFGPVVAIVPVDDDAAAIAAINDSRYGLTASIWSGDVEAAERIAPQLDVGTVFLNRADYLDPELAWVGVKDSGRGCTLSSIGYEHLTRPKSLHFRLR